MRDNNSEDTQEQNEDTPRSIPIEVPGEDDHEGEGEETKEDTIEQQTDDSDVVEHEPNPDLWQEHLESLKTRWERATTNEEKREVSELIEEVKSKMEEEGILDRVANNFEIPEPSEDETHTESEGYKSTEAEDGRDPATGTVQVSEDKSVDPSPKIDDTEGPNNVDESHRDGETDPERQEGDKSESGTEPSQAGEKNVDKSGTNDDITTQSRSTESDQSQPDDKDNVNENVGGTGRTEVPSSGGQDDVDSSRVIEETTDTETDGQDAAETDTEALRSGLEDALDRIDHLETLVSEYQRKNEREHDVMKKEALEDFATRILRVRDTLERLIEYGEWDDAGADQLNSLLRQFDQQFTAKSIDIVDPERGEEIDDIKHSLAGPRERADDIGPNRVLRVESKGYEVSGYPLRQAKVIATERESEQ